MNQRRLALQYCAACQKLQYPPQSACQVCGSAEGLEWRDVEGKGHIATYIVIEDGRLNRRMPDQPYNLALITLDEDPTVNFYSNLPGVPAYQAPVGAAVELTFEEVAPGPADNTSGRWRNSPCVPAPDTPGATPKAARFTRYNRQLSKGKIMTSSNDFRWRRDTDGLGVWEHRGQVAIAGYGHSPVDRRWDGVNMDSSLGAYTVMACEKAMEQAGVTIDQVDGIVCCDSHIAGGSGGSASQWAPRPYFDPPYDTEYGLTLINAQWLINTMGFKNVKFAPTGVPTIGEMMGMASQAVGDGVCSTCLVIYPTGNLEGRYRRGGENADDYARGARQWTVPWGNHGGNDFINIFPAQPVLPQVRGRARRPRAIRHQPA